MSEWITFFEKVGFPVTCVAGLAYFVFWLITTTRQDSKERELMLIGELKKLNNTNEKISRAIDKTVETNSVLVEEMKQELSSSKKALDDVRTDVKEIGNKIDRLSNKVECK